MRRHSTQQIDDGVLPPLSDASGNHAFPEPLRCLHPRNGKRAPVVAIPAPILRLVSTSRAARALPHCSDWCRIISPTCTQSIRIALPTPIVTDGGFRPDGTFVHWPAHDTAKLTEAFRRAVLKLFVQRGIFEDDDARSMLSWPHSGFHVHDSVLVPEGDTDFALRLARYCARNPVALDRLEW